MRVLSQQLCSSSELREKDLLERLAAGDVRAVKLLQELWCDEAGMEAKEVLLDGIEMLNEKNFKMAKAMFREVCREVRLCAVDLGDKSMLA